jgi:hypothetical protein
MFDPVLVRSGSGRSGDHDDDAYARYRALVFHTVVSSNDAFGRRLVGRIRRFVPISRRKKGDSLTPKCSPLNQLLLYCSRCVPVPFAYGENCGSLKGTIRDRFQGADGPGRIVSHRQVVGQAGVRHLHFAGRIRTRLNLRRPSATICSNRSDAEPAPPTS